MAGCGSDSTEQGRLWITTNHGGGARGCGPKHCGPAPATLHWRIQLAEATGYYIFVNGAQVADVKASEYIIAGMNCSMTVTLGVRAHDRAGASSPLQSTTYSTPGCGGAPSNRVAPYFTASTGRAVVGDTLEVNAGEWANEPASYSYQWQACRTTTGQPPRTNSCASITGATAPTYTISRSDVGHSLTVTVTATSDSGSLSTTVGGKCAAGESSSPSESGSTPPPAEPAGCSPISAVVGARDGSERFCSNAFVTCGYVDPLAGNVGVRPGSDLTPVSSTCNCLPAGASWDGGILSITGDGVTLEDLYVEGTVRISGSDDTLTNAEVAAGICPSACASPEPIVVLDGAVNARITHTTVSGGSNGTLHNASNEPVLWDHVYSYGACTGQLGWGDVRDSFIITDVAIAEQAGEGVCHTEAGYVPGCTSAHCVTWSESPWSGACPGRCTKGSDPYTNYQNDVMLNPQDQTAAIFLDNHAFNARGNHNVTINRSFVAGGGYAVYGDVVGDGSSNIVVTNNRWSAMYHPNGGTYGPCSWNPSATSLQGNVWDGDLEPLTMDCRKQS